MMKMCQGPPFELMMVTTIFRPYLRKFVLIFFDDILIYNSSLDDHLCHLRVVFSLLQKRSLFVKKSKCNFASPVVKYLGHIVFKDGVVVDPSKIQAMIDWPIPKTIKALWGFLGLIGYFCKFVWDYGKISSPLTALLKKEAFRWTEATEEAFTKLKHAMTITPMLALLDFTKTFISESDASGVVIGVVLM
jgi:hypothetical protein